MSLHYTDAIPVLMYHEVGEPQELADLHSVMQRNYLLEAGMFRRHLELMRQLGVQTVSLARLRQWQQGLASLPDRPVIITFDDGFAGNHRHVMPLLKEFGFTATFFVISGRVGTRHMMNWGQLVELRDAGFEFGSHTVSHALMSTLAEQATREELAASKAALEEGLGAPVEHFALPFGDRNAYYAGAMAGAGYVTGCTSEVGLVTRDSDPYLLPRFSMTSDVDLALLQRILLRDRRAIDGITRRIRIKRRVSRLLGKRNYERLASLVYGVKLKPGQRLD